MEVVRESEREGRQSVVPPLSATWNYYKLKKKLYTAKFMCAKLNSNLVSVARSTLSQPNDPIAQIEVVPLGSLEH